MSRFLAALALAGALTPIPLGAASASSTTAKRIAYAGGGDLRTISSDGTGTTSLGEIGNTPQNPSISTDGTTILFDTGASLRSVATGGPPGSSSSLCGLVGTNPAISPDGGRFAYVSGSDVVVRALDCSGSPTTIGAGTGPAWSPDGTQLVFIDSANDIAIADAAGGATEKLGATSAVESEPTWSPDGGRIAYISGDELFVLNADGTGRNQLTSNTADESSPTWAPGGDEILYASDDGHLYARVPTDGGSTRTLPGALSASQPSWGLAVANTARPTIAAAGPYAEGTELSAGVGSWTSLSGIASFTYEWLRCGSAGTGCGAIGGNGGTYTLGSGDVGGTIRVRVTANTPDGSAPGLSPATPAIDSAGPVSITLPTITGTPTVGQTLNANTGTWTGSNPVFTYQWKRCDASGAPCVDVGAQANVYVLTDDDVGKRMLVVVTATNSVGSNLRTSNQTGLVASNKPVNTEPPTISLEESTFASDDTDTFEADIGEWSGSPFPTFKYQWRRCDSGGNNCTNIGSATTLRYTTISADIGKRLRVAVTATNVFGTATAVSDPSEVVGGVAPTNMSRASISGSAQVGEQLFANEGTWRGSAPLSFTYEWRRCNALGSACAAVSGANAPTYVIEGADSGSRIVVAVTARNALGSATVQSAPTDVITDSTPTTPPTTPPTTAQPSATKAPAFSGTLARGKTLVAANGTWTGDAPLRFTYQWERCAPAAATCAPITRATATRYTIAAADVGNRIRLRVTASNAAGTVSAFSAISAKVAAVAKAAPKKKKAAKPSTRTGSAKADKLSGTAANDRIHGLGGDDRISGAGGADLLYGDEGADAIDGGAGRDRIWSGPGNDRVLAADGEVDVIDCGSGRDSVQADKNDVLRNCETVVRKSTTRRPLAVWTH